jgi:hypothetical protein
MASAEIKTNLEFVKEKLTNFKAHLRAHSNTPEKVDEWDAYTIDHFLVFGAMNLMPLEEQGKLHVATEKTIERYDIKEDAEARAKIGRYYEFLVAFLKSVKSSHQRRE